LFGTTLFLSVKQLKSEPYKSRNSKLEYQAKLQLGVLSRAFEWLREGLNISESWIEQSPHDVANYLNFRQGTLNTSNAPPQGAHQPIRPNNAIRLEGAPQPRDNNNIVEIIQRLRIEDSEM
jgi:hypothetical protein